MKPMKPAQPAAAAPAIEPDAHLRAALRHAPDAAVQAPPELGAQIVAAAYRAAAEAPAPAAQARRAGLADWLWGSTWRLGASGAFASVLMAGVIGLLWREGAPGPAVDEAAPAATAPLAPPAAAPAPEPEPLAVTAVPSDPRPQPQPPSKPPPPPPPAARALPARPATAATPPMPTLHADLPAAPPPVMEKARAQADAAVQRPHSAGPAAPPAALPAAPAAQPATAARAADAPASSLSLSGTRAAAEPAATAGASDRLGTGLAPAPARMRQATVATPPLPWASASAQAGTAWLDGRPLAADAAWLQALQRQTAGLWRGAPAARPAAAQALLEWRQGDRQLGRLWLDEQGALWCPAPDSPAPCEVAPLSAQALADLKEKLPR